MAEDNSDVPPQPPSDEEREVVESKDVSDLDEGKVNSEIDQMLAGETPDDDRSAAEKLAEREAAETPDDDPEPEHTTNQSSGDDRHSETQSDTISTDSDFSNADPAEIDPAELEAQDWTLGDSISEKLFDMKGTTFLLEEPESDEVLNIIGGGAGGQQQQPSPSENMRDLIQLTVAAPQITDGRWEDMGVAERLGMMMEVSEFIGLDEFLDFQDVGPEAPQA